MMLRTNYHVDYFFGPWDIFMIEDAFILLNDFPDFNLLDDF